MPPSPGANPPNWLPNTWTSPRSETSEGPWTWPPRAREAVPSGALLEPYSEVCPAAELAPAQVVPQLPSRAVVQQEGTQELGVRLWGRPNLTLGCPSPPSSSVVLLLLPPPPTPKSPAVFPVAFSKVSRSHNTDSAPSSSELGQNSPDFVRLSR